MRVVQCIQMGVVVPDNHCDPDLRPKSEQFCNAHIQCRRKLPLYPMCFF